MRELQAADANGDHRITKAEFTELANEIFAYRDRNGDGVIDIKDESPVVQRLFAKREAEWKEHRAQAGKDHQGKADGDKKTADKDGHGDGGRWHGRDGHERRITKQEFMDRELRLFARLDTNGDGVITPDELDARADAQRNRGRWWRAS
jgi:hypothetical protein